MLEMRKKSESKVDAWIPKQARADTYDRDRNHGGRTMWWKGEVAHIWVGHPRQESRQQDHVEERGHDAYLGRTSKTRIKVAGPCGGMRIRCVSGQDIQVKIWLA